MNKKILCFVSVLVLTSILVVAPVMAYAFSFQDIIDRLFGAVSSVSPQSMTYPSVETGRIYTGTSSLAVDVRNGCTCASGNGIYNCRPVISKESYTFESYYKHIVQFELMSVTNTASSNSCAGATVGTVDVYCTLDGTTTKIISGSRNAMRVGTECDVVRVDVVSEINGYIMGARNTATSANFRMVLTEQFCSDGTMWGGCAANNPPKKCISGTLVDDQSCACPAGYEHLNNANACTPIPTCGDAYNTLRGNCQMSNGVKTGKLCAATVPPQLTDACTTCWPCPSGTTCRTGGSLVGKCSQTAYSGDGYCDSNENCGTAPTDCTCSSGQVCKQNGASYSCGAPVCTAAVGSCNDNDPCTVDTCLNPSSSTARCSYTIITSIGAVDGCCPSGAVASGAYDCSSIQMTGARTCSGYSGSVTLSCPANTCSSCSYSCSGSSTASGSISSGTNLDVRLSRCYGSGCTVSYTTKVPRANTDPDCSQNLGDGLCTGLETCANAPSDCQCSRMLPDSVCSGSGSAATCLMPRCRTDAECGDDNDCTSDVCVNAGKANSYCLNDAKTCGVSGDGCCPVGCTRAYDTDCSGCSDGTALKTCKSGSIQYCDAFGDMADNCKQCPNCPQDTTCNEFSGKCEKTCMQMGGFVCGKADSCQGGVLSGAVDIDNQLNQCCTTTCRTSCTAVGGKLYDETKQGCSKKASGTIEPNCCMADPQDTCASQKGTVCSSSERCTQNATVSFDTPYCCLGSCTSEPKLTFSNINNLNPAVFKPLAVTVSCVKAFGNKPCFGYSITGQLFKGEDLKSETGTYLLEDGTGTLTFPAPTVSGTYRVVAFLTDQTFGKVKVESPITVGSALKVQTNLESTIFNNGKAEIEVIVTDESDQRVSLNVFEVTSTLDGIDIRPTISILGSGDYKLIFDGLQNHEGTLNIHLKMSRFGSVVETKDIQTLVKKPVVEIVVNIPAQIQGVTTDIPIEVKTFDPKGIAMSVDSLTAKVTYSNGQSEDFVLTEDTYTKGTYRAIFHQKGGGVFYKFVFSASKAGFMSYTTEPATTDIIIAKGYQIDPMLIGGVVVVTVGLLLLKRRN